MPQLQKAGCLVSIPAHRLLAFRPIMLSIMRMAHRSMAHIRAVGFSLCFLIAGSAMRCRPLATGYMTYLFMSRTCRVVQFDSFLRTDGFSTTLIYLVRRDMVTIWSRHVAQ